MDNFALVYSGDMCLTDKRWSAFPGIVASDIYYWYDILMASCEAHLSSKDNFWLKFLSYYDDI